MLLLWRLWLDWFNFKLELPFIAGFNGVSTWSPRDSHVQIACSFSLTRQAREENRFLNQTVSFLLQPVSWFLGNSWLVGLRSKLRLRTMLLHVEFIYWTARGVCWLHCLSTAVGAAERTCSPFDVRTHTIITPDVGGADGHTLALGLPPPLGRPTLHQK